LWGFQGLKIIRLKQMLCCCTDRWKHLPNTSTTLSP
jgi:hypothetical protein